MNVAEAVAEVRRGDDAPLGAVVGISFRGRSEIAADGSRSPDGTPVTADTVFDLASVTKVAATTSAVHRLITLGEIALGDPVARYLPSSPCTPETTVDDLLTHRAGLWEWQPLYFSPEPRRALASLPLRYPPGTARHYSDLGFLLLGRIIEVVTETALDTAVDRLIHAPLGMTDTGYGPVAARVASSSIGDRAEQRMVRTGEPYPVLWDTPADFAWRETEIAGEANDGNCFHAYGGVSGHAGLFSTAADLLTLGASLAEVDLDAGLWGETASAAVFRDGPDPGQARGWRSMDVVVDGARRRMLWHPGYTGCALGFVPGEELAVVLLTNRLFAQNVPAVTDLWARALAPLAELDIQSPTER